MIHNIRFRLFVYEWEKQEDLTQAIFNILLEAEIIVEEAEGITGDKILILSGTINKKKYTKEFFNNLLALDKDQLNKLDNDFERKIDDNGNLFLRFSKEDALNEKWTIVDSGDTLHLKVKIAAYPARKEIAINKVRDAINNQ